MQKSFTGAAIKSAAKGEFSAVFATLNVIDKDGDVITTGAIKDGAEVVISAYGHKSWEGLMPVGKGAIRMTDTEAIVDGKFFLDTVAGKETFTVVKELGALQEWSFSLEGVISEYGEFDGKAANLIKSVRVKEVSPVLVGAGVDTRTLDVKSEGGMSIAHGVIPADPVAKVDALRKAHAWVDPNGNPESAGSYAFEHHKADGSVDLRACLVGIAHLNGAKGAPVIPDADRKGVYDHLAGHLADADFRAPDLKGPGGAGFTAELSVALVDVEAALDRAGAVMALRSAKGKGLSSEASLLVEWIKDALRKAQDVLDTPHDALAREYLRHIQITRPQED